MAQLRQLSIQEAFQKALEQKHEPDEPQTERDRLEMRFAHAIEEVPPIEVIRSRFGPADAEEYRDVLERLEQAEDHLSIPVPSISTRKIWSNMQLRSKMLLVSMLADAGTYEDALVEFEDYEHRVKRMKEREKKEQAAVKQYGKKPRKKKKS